MSDHDRLGTALRDEERRILEELPEDQSILSLMAGSLRSRMRPYVILHIVLGTMVTIACVVSIVQVFGAETTKAQLLWALAAIGTFLWVGLAKVQLWMQLERRAILLELKRAEVRILEAVAAS